MICYFAKGSFGNRKLLLFQQCSK